MSNSGRNLRAILTALSVACALVAVWQFYLFVQFKDAAGSFDPQGGGPNLWLAVAAAVGACAAGGYVAFSVVNHDKEDVMHITS